MSSLGSTLLEFPQCLFDQNRKGLTVLVPPVYIPFHALFDGKSYPEAVH